MPAKKSSSKKTAKKTPAKKAVKKAAPKKAAKKPAKKPAAKKTVAKTASRKTGSKKTAKKKASKGTAKKKSSAKKATSKKSSPKKATQKKRSPEKASAGEESEEVKGAASEEVTRRVTEALKSKKREPKSGEDDSRKGQPVVFTLSDLRDFLKTRKDSPPEEEAKPTPKKQPAKKKEPAKKVAEEVSSRGKQSFGAASVADLLGFDPTSGAEADATSKTTEEGVPKKFLPYYRALVKLHEEVYEGLHRHAEETLRRSNKEDSGDLSSYGQHMADAGTDSFDRDFALSMVSNEQEALYEIDEAIRRIREGNYGVCEITGKPISRERLRAVPFTRYSVEGQTEVERGKTKKVQKAGIQGIDGDDAPTLSDEDSDD